MENLWVLPTNRDLVGAEVELVDAEEREFRLRKGLAEAREAYDYVFIDCPPSFEFVDAEWSGGGGWGDRDVAV